MPESSVHGWQTGTAVDIDQWKKPRHFGRDAEIQRPGMANWNRQRTLIQAFVQQASYRPWHWIPASLTGMTCSGVRPFPNPRHFGIHAGMTAFLV